MPNKRDDFTKDTKDRMAKRVGYRCSNPHCRKLTCGAAEVPDGFVNIGVAAHIRAAAPDGKRYDQAMSASQRKSILNGIWLCQSCSKLIDSDENRYTVELLYEWKYGAETESITQLENGTNDVSIPRHFTSAERARSVKDDQSHLLAALNQEIDQLLARIEKIDEKLDAAKQDENVVMTQAYEKRLEGLVMMYTSLSEQLKEKLTYSSSENETVTCVKNVPRPSEPRPGKPHPKRSLKAAIELAAGATTGILGIISTGHVGAVAVLFGSVMLGLGFSELFNHDDRIQEINAKVEFSGNPEVDQAISYIKAMQMAVVGLESEVEKLHMARIVHERSLVQMNLATDRES